MLRPAGGVRSAAKEGRQLGVRRHLPPVQHRVEVALEPERADRGAVVQFDFHVDADVAELPFDRLRDAFTDRETGLRDQGEGQRLSIALADAAGAGLPPASSSSRRGLAGSKRIA
jgi:hypothetical protein